MGPEEAEAVLETIWDLHDKVSDAIHALSRAHFLRAVRRRASASGDKPAAGLVYVKGGGLGLGVRGGDEVAALATLADEARSLHAIRAALEDLEDQFECFLAVQSQQQAERDFALARLEQSRIMLAIRLKEHHGKNHEVIDEASDFVHNVYQDVWPSLSATKPEKCADSSSNTTKGPNFFARMVSSSLAIAGSCFNLKSLGCALGNSAALALGIVTVLQLRWLASGAHSSGVGNYSYRRISEKDSSSRFGTSPSGSRTARLDVSLARG
ncbi:plastid division protein PDV1-like [Miscanthus floridulus]|uniref:plastid division protein PDV1-like n=1 Tax=Miscanthus floridulus TaxID=154761 RepID=UPI003458A0AE